MKLDTFINRPVLSTVISIFIVLLGLIGLSSLPVTQYPDIAPPTISVSTTYAGANAQAVLNSVIAPLEESINGAEGMTYIESTATNTGSATINVHFKQGFDPDMAAVDEQNRWSVDVEHIPQHIAERAADQIEIQEIFPAEGRSGERSEHPETEHIEKQMPEIKMGERRRDEPPEFKVPYRFRCQDEMPRERTAQHPDYDIDRNQNQKAHGTGSRCLFRLLHAPHIIPFT